MQAASVTMALALLDQKLPSLISATATITCEVASRIRVETSARPERGPRWKTTTFASRVLLVEDADAAHMIFRGHRAFGGNRDPDGIAVLDQRRQFQPDAAVQHLGSAGEGL